MKSNPVISKLLVETGAYRDLDKPTILASGALGIYYVNTEKLLQDDGAWEKVGEDSQAMIQHAVKMMDEKPSFRKVIDIIASETNFCLTTNSYAISGGQRRDWLFSGPVAKRLHAPHISIYKNGKIELINMDGSVSTPESLEGFAQIVHVVDLITEGSSVYRTEEGEEKGWIPEMRKLGGNVQDLAAVVTRLQGGEKMLEKQGVSVDSFVAIDEDFLKEHSTNPERAVAYQRNPRGWSENYLKENGALDFVDFFNPVGGKVERGLKFLERYGGVLGTKRFWELDTAVRKKFGVQLK